MKLFKNYTLSWKQIGVFKFSLLSLGVAIGAYWSEFFSQYVLEFALLGLLLGLYIFFVASKQ